MIPVCGREAGKRESFGDVRSLNLICGLTGSVVGVLSGFVDCALGGLLFTEINHHLKRIITSITANPQAIPTSPYLLLSGS